LSIHTDNRQTKLGYNLAWAKTYLKRIHALENSGRGVWALTPIGEGMTEQDCKDVPRRVRRQDYERKKATEDRVELEKRQAGADWQAITYGGTVHSFTNPAADGSRDPGIRYNEQSDRQSRAAMSRFFDEVFARV
jgi:hypothetical protein